MDYKDESHNKSPKLPEEFRLNSPKYKILTPKGYESFYGVNKIVRDEYIHLKFSNGKEIRCSENHPFLTINGITLARDLDKVTQIETKDGVGCFVKSKRLIRRKIELYDIVNSGVDKLYYSNGIVSHNCEFLGSTNTLISGEKLACLNYIEPIRKYEDMVIFEEPITESYDEEAKLTQHDHQYVITVDVSEGKNLDYSCFSVFDCSVMPYKQVAKYASNAIPPMLFPNVIKTCAEYYNNAYVLVEINMNPQVAEILCDELEYEYVFRVYSGNKQAQTITAYETNRPSSVQYGIRMSPLVKRIGCSTLKTLLEHDKLILNDFTTISELTTFTQQKNSFAADEGAFDDHVMTLIMFSWLTLEQRFKDMVDQDIRKMLQAEKFKLTDDDFALPLTKLPTQTEKPYFIEDNSVWFETDSFDSYDNLLKNAFF